MPTEEELIGERKRKLAEIRNIGINPYPYSFNPTHKAADLHATYNSLLPEQHTEVSARVAGRIVGLRRMGKATFMHVLDDTEKLQLYFKQDNMGEEKYGFLKLLDIGDWVGITGFIFKTKTGEVTLDVRTCELLCKSLRPLPEKWHGLQDTELRYRQRYVDMIVNPGVRKTFLQRSQIIRCIRDFFHDRNYVEVETPVLQPIYGGANARPFTTHMHDLDLKMYLRIALEMYLKRLVVGGFERVFEISRVFRNESMDRDHNPEFTMIEFYQAYADYNAMMDLTEDLFVTVATRVLGTTTLEYQGKKIELRRPWARIRMVDAIKEHAGIDVEQLSDAELLRIAREKRVELPDGASRGIMIAAFFGQLAEQHLIQPTFVIDHPIETTPLCKPLRDGSKDTVERFELFMNGMEIANAYSELNDPLLQRKLLEDQAKDLRAGNAEAHPMDEDFIHAIEQGMPPTGGVGIGIDRMIMLLTNQASIRDIILFPTMKPKE